MIATDQALSVQAIDAGAASPALWTAARIITELGGAIALWIVTLIAATLLWRHRLRRHAIALLVIVSLGRLSVELLKAWTARPRPDLIDHPVVTHSLSLPSGHAANAMMVYLSVALLFAAPARRRAAVLGAVLLSVAIGLTRPILGVHWPSDVLAGWLWGAGFVLVGTGLAARWLEGDRARPPSAVT